MPARADIPPAIVPVILGATASGKTAMGIGLAELLNGEIVSADSRQIYRGLTIGTAKPSAADLARVPHHFIDELDLMQPFNAGAFANAALNRIADIFSRGKTPVAVGGSTLYLNALINGLNDLPPADNAVRNRLTQELNNNGASALYDRLLRIDPKAAGTLDATKTQRLIRALEVFEITGIPISDFHTRLPRQRPYRFIPFGLAWEREKLYARINSRTLQMLTDGFLDEATFLFEKYSDVVPFPNSLNTVGYKEAFAYFSGEINERDLVRLIQQRTRNYAKRQLTYFRRDSSISWLTAPGSETEMGLTVQKILDILRRSTSPT
jgi:tRNA dimethylallyltransferase